MFQKLFGFLCLIIIVLCGCKKEVTEQKNSINSSSAINTFSDDALAKGVEDTSQGWYGQYSGYDGPYPDIPDSLIIKNGVAKIPTLSQSFDFTNIVYDIPPDHIIAGDSVVFEAAVKNPKNNSFYDYDVVLELYGDEHKTQVEFVADLSARQYNHIFVGDSHLSALPNLVHYFENFQVLKLVLKNNNASVFLDDQFVCFLPYGPENRIGRLEKINIAGKGFIICDKVRLFNSYTHKRILTEDFNTDGKSHVIYY